MQTQFELSGRQEMLRSIDLAREGLYRFLAAALRDPRDQVAALARDPESQALAVAAADLLRTEAGGQAIRRGLGELPADLLTLSPMLQMRQDSLDDLGAEYDRVFGLITVKECPPYETEFHVSSEPFFRSQQIADIAGFYRGFGLALKSPERPDYLPFELEFIAFLLMKKRLAVEAQDVDNVEVCAAAEISFFRDHFAWWVPAFATAVRRRAASGRYAHLAEVLAALIPLERQRLGVDTTSVPAQPTVIEQPDEDPLGCAGCAATAPSPGVCGTGAPNERS
jgi:nitrate reductase assembly molybdenum cofactor insertion protein NarJ